MRDLLSMRIGLAIQSAWNEDGEGFINTLPPIEFSDAELLHLGRAALMSQAEVEQLRKIVEVVAEADSEDAIGSLDVDIPSGGHPRQWLRDAARASLTPAQPGEMA